MQNKVFIPVSSHIPFSGDVRMDLQALAEPQVDCQDGKKFLHRKDLIR